MGHLRQERTNDLRHQVTIIMEELGGKVAKKDIHRLMLVRTLRTTNKSTVTKVLNDLVREGVLFSFDLMVAGEMVQYYSVRVGSGLTLNEVADLAKFAGRFTGSVLLADFHGAITRTTRAFLSVKVKFTNRRFVERANGSMFEWRVAVVRTGRRGTTQVVLTDAYLNASGQFIFSGVDYDTAEALGLLNQ